MQGAAFEQGELVSLPAQAVSKLRAGAGLALSLPLVRRFAYLSHTLSPRLLGRVERRHWDGDASSFVAASAGLETSLGHGSIGAAAGRLWLAGGVAGDPSDPEPVAETNWSADARLLGLRLSARAEPQTQAAEGTARLRLGARSGTTFIGYAEARSDEPLTESNSQSGGELLPSFHELGGYDRAGLTTGAELTLNLWSVVALGGGVDLDPLAEELLALRSFARYRHACGCVALAGFGSKRVGRGGFDVGLSLDLMP